MYIKYMPTSRRAQSSTRPAPTNIGEFLPGQVGGPYTTPSAAREAKRLVKNGEFVECDPKGGDLVAETPALHTTDHLAAMKVADLTGIAKALGIDVSNLRKQELIDAIVATGKNTE